MSRGVIANKKAVDWSGHTRSGNGGPPAGSMSKAPVGFGGETPEVRCTYCTHQSAPTHSQYRPPPKKKIIEFLQMLVHIYTVAA